MLDSKIDCKSEVGITIGLIDSMISISRVLSRRLRKLNIYENEEILEALKDLTSDDDIKYIAGVYEGSEIAPLSKEQIEDRKVISELVNKIKKENIKIEL